MPQWLLAAVKAGADVFESSETSNIATKSISRRVARWESPRCSAARYVPRPRLQFHSFHALKFDLEEEGRVGGDDASSSASTIAQGGRDSSSRLPPTFMVATPSSQPAITSRAPSLERERLAVVLRAVELRSPCRDRSHSHPV